MQDLVAADHGLVVGRFERASPVRVLANFGQLDEDVTEIFSLRENLKQNERDID